MSRTLKTVFETGDGMAELIRLVTEPKKAKPRLQGGPQPTEAQMNWLARGLNQAGGKLPLFDGDGKRFSERTVISCINKGWALPWFDNPIKPDWQVCKLTEAGRKLIS